MEEKKVGFSREIWEEVKITWAIFAPFMVLLGGVLSVAGLMSNLPVGGPTAFLFGIGFIIGGIACGDYAVTCLPIKKMKLEMIIMMAAALIASLTMSFEKKLPLGMWGVDVFLFAGYLLMWLLLCRRERNEKVSSTKNPA